MSATHSLRYRIIEAIQTRLAYITVAHGYHTDAGEHIFKGEAPTFGPDDPPAALAIVVGADTVVQQKGSRTITDVPIEIQACVPVDLTDPLLAVEDIIADIRQAIEVEGNNPAPLAPGDASIDRSLDALCTPKGFRRGSTRPIAREPGATYGGAACEYIAQIDETWGRP